MAWTTPQNWTAVPFTVSNLNAQIRDNFLALKAPPTAIYNAVEGTDLALTSTSWADVDATAGKFSQSITTTGGDIWVVLDAAVGVGGVDVLLYLDISIDGVAYGVTTLGAADGLYANRFASAGAVLEGHISFHRLLTSIAAGSHTIKIRYKVSAGTLTIFRAANTASVDICPMFFIREVS